MRGSALLVGSIVLVGGLLAIPVGNDTVGSRFLASLRIAKPTVVTAAGPAPSAAGSRQLLNVVAGILAESSTVVLDEPDMPMPNADSAARAAGFPVQLVHARSETPTLDLLGGRRLSMQLNRDQLQTLLTEAGRPANVASALNGAAIALGRPRGVRAQYGRCPVAPANSLQNQIQGPPPPSQDNGNCVILTEVPVAVLTLPAGLDTASVLEIALELTGMSPNQARDFRSVFDWPGALTISAPRSMRSYEIKAVSGAPAMLMIGGGRREPAYTLTWVQHRMVYTLAGYGSSADAVPLAESVH